MGEQQGYRNTSMKNRHTNSVTHPNDTSPCRWCETVRFSNRVSSDNVFQFLKAQNYSFFCSSLFFWNCLWESLTIIFTHTYLVYFFILFTHTYLDRCVTSSWWGSRHSRETDRQTDRELLTSVFSFWNFGDRGNRWMITRPVDVGEALWISVTVTTFPGLLFLFPRLLLSPVMYLWQRNCQCVTKKLSVTTQRVYTF